jgi:hypothetical protein
MHEAFLLKKSAVVGGSGITIASWGGGLSNSAGVTKTGSTYSFAGGSVVDYIRIPYSGTPSPVAENCQITIRFKVTTIGGTRLDLLSRYKQGNDAPSWMISVNANKAIEYVYDNILATASGSISGFGIEQVLVFKRVNGVYTITLNGTQIYSLNYPGTFSNTWDWVLGSYLNGAEQVIQGTYAFPCTWQLLELTVIRI